MQIYDFIPQTQPDHPEILKAHDDLAIEQLERFQSHRYRKHRLNDRNHREALLQTSRNHLKI